MQSIAMLGTLAFVLAGTATGLRLLRLARRSGQRPELYLGASLFAYAALGQPAVLASRALGAGARVWLLALGLLAIGTSVAMALRFVRHVYRPDAGWARAAVAVGSALAAGSALVILVSLSDVPGEQTPGVRLGVALLSVVFGLANLWSAVESLRYHRMMRRRQALGLADPIVTNRFLLWGVGTSTVGLSSFAMIACAAAGLDTVTHPLPLLLTAASGTIVSCCWTLAFFPVSGYRRLVAGRAAAQEG